MSAFSRLALGGLIGLSQVFAVVGASAQTPIHPLGKAPPLEAPADPLEYIAKLPSIAGDVQNNLWVLDARGERLIHVRDGQTRTVDLWLPDGSNFAYTSDVVAHKGWVYLSGTFKDAVYKVSTQRLLALWAASAADVTPKVRLQRVSASDPLLAVMQQHFLRTGLWLAGQPRQALLERAQMLAKSGWPVLGGTRPTGSVRYDPEASSQGQLCLNMQTSMSTDARGAASKTCTPLPAGWQVGAVYPVGLRPMATGESCSTQPLSAKAQWLWMEVDVVGESAHSIESRTLLMRAAVDQGQLRCWDSRGFVADAHTSASLMRLFALVGNTPTTLASDSQAHWFAKEVTLAADFWPEPLAPFAAERLERPALTPMPMQSPSPILARALPYAQQRWTLPQSAAAQARYASWQKEGFFARCFPEAEACGKPLGPRYLAQGQVHQTYVGLPYGWGASDTPERYVERIAEGAYPGDIHTNNVILKTIAGVDCSGFITNVWQLPQRVVTTCRGGPDAWTPKPGDTTCVGAFSSRVDWQAAQAGDALLIPGHVRLVAQASEPSLANTGRGLFVEIVESSGFCAGACHRLLPIREAGRYRMMRPHANSQ